MITFDRLYSDEITPLSSPTAPVSPFQCHILCRVINETSLNYVVVSSGVKDIRHRVVYSGASAPIRKMTFWYITPQTFHYQWDEILDFVRFIQWVWLLSKEG